MERLTLVFIKVFDQNNMSETERSHVFPSSALEKCSTCPWKDSQVSATFLLTNSYPIIIPHFLSQQSSDSCCFFSSPLDNAIFISLMLAI